MIKNRKLRNSLILGSAGLIGFGAPTAYTVITNEVASAKTPDDIKLSYEQLGITLGTIAGSGSLSAGAFYLTSQKRRDRITEKALIAKAQAGQPIINLHQTKEDRELEKQKLIALQKEANKQNALHRINSKKSKLVNKAEKNDLI